MGLGDAERPYLAMSWMKDRQSGNLIPMAGEVRRHSSYQKKLKKRTNKYRTSYKYTMQQYILEKHINNKWCINKNKIHYYYS